MFKFKKKKLDMIIKRKFLIVKVFIVYFQVPIFIPGIVFLMAVYLVLAPVIQNPKIEFFFAFLFICSGLLFYFPFVYMRLMPPGMGK